VASVALVASLAASGCGGGPRTSTDVATKPTRSSAAGPNEPSVTGSVSAPLGLPCREKNGVRLCAPAELDQRVPSFDGTPIDLNVFLPASRSGPWPTVVLIHGYGGSKDSVGSGTPSALARRGYVVVVPSMRGFGNSCGPDASTRNLGCSEGFIHNADQRYEVRDVQTLLGWLVDERVASRRALASAGGSYGGGISLELAFLRNRIRLPDGSFAPWRSPAGAPIALKAAWATSPWSDLASALAPNGRSLESSAVPFGTTVDPPGVPTSLSLNALASIGGSSGWAGAAGSDGKGQLGIWAATLAADPSSQGSAQVLAEMHKFHSAAGISGTPSALLLEAGWTDDLFPPREALRVLLARSTRNRAALLIGDLGHSRAQNRPDDTRWATSLGLAFLQRQLRSVPGGPAAGSVSARSMICGSGSPQAWTTSSWADLHPRAVEGRWRGAGVLSSRVGASSVTGQAEARLGACDTVPESMRAARHTYNLTSKGFTLAGLPVVRANLSSSGGVGQIVARLWDVSGGRQRLITRGVYRVTQGQHGQVAFQLNGNAYKFAAGHTVRLELLGADPPLFQGDTQPATVQVSEVELRLPVR